MTEKLTEADTLQVQLKQPFAVSVIHWRIGNTNLKKVQRETGSKDARPTKGQALAYIDARDVMKRLDDVVGIGGWQDKYTETARGRVICELSIRMDGEWITKSDAAGDTSVEGEKGGVSDAFKRAAVKFGVGRYLYYLKPVWVDLNNGFAPNNMNEICNKTLPTWAIPKYMEQQ